MDDWRKRVEIDARIPWSPPGKPCIKVHPVTFTPEPIRKPDARIGQDKYYFEEMVIVQANSSGFFDDPSRLAICPVTGLLMYMRTMQQPQWTLINDDKVQRAFASFVLEKTMLEVT